MLTQEVNKKFTGPERLRQNLTAEVVAGIQKALGDQLKPLKLEIAKTWMQMQADSRDKYANAVKSSFEEVFKNAGASITLHAGIATDRAVELIKDNPKKTDTELLAESVKVVEEDLFAEHCHVNNKKEKYCIPSPVAGFKTRLNDAQALVGMSLKFENGFVFIQKDNDHNKKGIHSNQKKQEVLQAAKK